MRAIIFDLVGNYDVAWRVGVSISIVAGIVQILFGGPSGKLGGTLSGTRSDARPQAMKTA